MSYLDLLFCAAVLGGSLAAKIEAAKAPPAELLENLDLLDDMGILEDEGDR